MAAVTTGAKDAANNPVAANDVQTGDFVWFFQTGIAPDITPPEVLGTNPVDGQTGVLVRPRLQAIFSEAMAAETLTTATFTLVPSAGGAPVAGTVAMSGATAEFVPEADLAPNTQYSATLTTGARDAAGNPLAADFVVHFTTGAPALYEPLPEALDTEMAALDLITIGQILIAADCASGINCPGGVPGSPVPLTLTRSALSVTPSAFNPTLTLRNYDFVAQLSITGTLPLNVLGVPCSLSINSAPRAVPTVQLTGQSAFVDQTTGEAGNRLDITRLDMTAPVPADLFVTGGFVCSLTRTADLIGSLVGLISAALPRSFCGALGPATFVECSPAP